MHTPKQTRSLNPKRGLCLTLAVLGLGFLSACSPKPESLFNGKDLSGWTGDQEFWSVKDGAITGQTTPEKEIPSNTFLILEGKRPDNFELKLKFRMSAQNDRNFANSGIQYRSQIMDAEKFVVGGYQADIDLAGKYVGMLYEERGRGIVMMPGEKIRILPASPDSDKKANVEKQGMLSEANEISSIYHPNEWNDFRIVAQGNHMQHFLNGLPTADIIDEDPQNARPEGVIALQLHRGPPMTVQFKDLELTPLP